MTASKIHLLYSGITESCNGRRKSQISARPSIIRAASNGDADAVRALLAEGTDVNQRARDGKTALMLAAIFGYVDIARLLLAAGGDVRLQDNLGLTAREWADRRGSSEVAQLLINASPAEIALSPKNAPAKHARPKVEAERRIPAAEAKTTPQQDAPSGTEEPQRTKPDPQRREVEQERRASPIETKIAPQQDAPNVADEQQRTKSEPERRKTEEARPTATPSARIAARIEHLRILEESRQRVDAEVRAKAQRATRPAMLEPKTSEWLNPPPIKRCPKCNATYENALVGYCAYDATRLISADDPLFNSTAANDWAQPTLWALVAIIAVGGASTGYLINNYLSREKGSSAPIAAQMEQPENARKDLPILPIIDGALSGLEVNVPEPEYPAKAKTEGVSGTVTVQVRVNKNGRVISARSSSGDWRLRAAAVKAAQKATFSAEKLAGRGAIGTITYVFRL